MTTTEPRRDSLWSDLKAAFTGPKNDNFTREMEAAFAARRPARYKPRHAGTDRTVTPVRTLEEFHTHHPVRPVPSGTVHRAAYFRRSEVQNIFAAVESANVDDELKREIRSAVMFVVSELAGFSETIERMHEELEEMRRGLDKIEARYTTPE